MSTVSLPMLPVPRVAHNIRVDGNLHKAPWTQLAPIWLVPSHGRAAPHGFQSTALRVCHDGERLFVAFACEDAAIVASHTGRNAPIYEEDVVEAFLAPGADPRRYFELETSPRNAWFEARVESPDGRRDTMRVDRDWVCAGFEHAVHVRGCRDEAANRGAPNGRSRSRRSASLRRARAIAGAPTSFASTRRTAASIRRGRRRSRTRRTSICRTASACWCSGSGRAAPVPCVRAPRFTALAKREASDFSPRPSAVGPSASTIS